MTTLAYKEGILAYESRRTSGDTVTTDSAEKLFQRGDTQFLLCGSVADYEAFLQAVEGKIVEKPVDVGGFILRDGLLWLAGYCNHSGFWKYKVEPGSVYAQGSGASFAYGAMDMGASAEEAVRVACGRDIYSGGTVRTLRVA